MSIITLKKRKYSCFFTFSLSLVLLLPSCGHVPGLQASGHCLLAGSHHGSWGGRSALLCRNPWTAIHQVPTVFLGTEVWPICYLLSPSFAHLAFEAISSLRDCTDNARSYIATGRGPTVSPATHLGSQATTAAAVSPELSQLDHKPLASLNYSPFQLRRNEYTPLKWPASSWPISRFPTSPAWYSLLVLIWVLSVYSASYLQFLPTAGKGQAPVLGSSDWESLHSVLLT